jgi:hypothetical protein
MYIEFVLSTRLSVINLPWHIPQLIGMYLFHMHNIQWLRWEIIC